MELVWKCLGVMIGLLLFGMVYNALVELLERDGHDQGYTAVLVVGGTLVTLGGVALMLGRVARLVGLEGAAVALACFSASGLPMVVGSVSRYARGRAAAEEQARQITREILNGHKT